MYKQEILRIFYDFANEICKMNDRRAENKFTRIVRKKNSYICSKYGVSLFCLK